MTGLKARIAKLEEARRFDGLRKILARSGNEALVDTMQAIKEPVAAVLFLLGALPEADSARLRVLLADVPAVRDRMNRRERAEEANPLNPGT